METVLITPDALKGMKEERIMLRNHRDILMKERDELAKALRISTNGLRHCSRWNISDEKREALMTQVIYNESILEKYPPECS